MAQNLKEIMEAERTRLTTRKTEIEAELAGIDHELEAIHRYFGTPTEQPRPRRAPVERAERGSVKTLVLDTIKAAPDGLTRADLIDKLPGTKDQSISNALSALTKDKAIVSDGRGGKYRTGPPQAA